MLARTPSASWVRRQLELDPMDALTVESLIKAAPIEGRVRLFAKEKGGPFEAAVHTEDAVYRGTGTTLGLALARAMDRATAA